MRRILLSKRCPFVREWRAARMREMVRRTGLFPGARIIDLGGARRIWDLIKHDFQITLVNLCPFPPGEGRYAVVQADACQLDDRFADQSFDFVFSNSTIEHVGDTGQMRRFADQVLRLAPAYWVQTPSSRFPIECHTGVPFYWQLPEPAKEWFTRRRRHLMPEWDLEIQGTRLVRFEELSELLPNSLVYRERKWGFEKSYSVYRPCATGAGVQPEARLEAPVGA